MSEYEEYLNLVKKKGSNIDVVPAKYMTFELCSEALKNSTNYVAWKIGHAYAWSDELVDFYIEDSTVQGFTLQLIPEKFYTYERCMKAVIKTDGFDIDTVPDEMITYEMCLTAATLSHGECLEEIPERFKTKELCLEALLSTLETEDCEELLEYVPVEFKNEEMIQALIRNGNLEESYLPSN